MKRSIIGITTLLLVVFFISGCLTVEKKEYTFTLNDDNSGTLTIKYINIMSVMDDTLDVSDEDFDELIYSYLEGDGLEEDFPEAELVERRLFQDGGVLCGELVFEFNDYEEVKLYRYKREGPFMFCVNCSFDAEEFEMSNGSFGGEIMPVVFWEDDIQVLKLLTSTSPPDESTISLLPHYLEWSGE